MNEFVCPSWLSFILDNPIRRMIQSPEKIVGNYVKPGHTVLDMGCGPGFFSIPMARMVGKNGRVIAVDVQETMLDRVRKRAARYDLLDRISAIRCSPEDIGVRDKVDFALTFWMVHEVSDKERLFRQIAGILRKEARYLIAEPTFHVTKKEYRRIIQIATSAGLKLVSEPSLSLSRSALFSI
ncbi:MAG: hypothetical protein A2176_00145 [Spirochaetes bacterium RBG_13_51_14]|nr:MAG: hypothetical protein A2176_00145 [Spirochaetes bacterium RBG_13_51_14]